MGSLFLYKHMFTYLMMMFITIKVLYKEVITTTVITLFECLEGSGACISSFISTQQMLVNYCHMDFKI